MRERDLHSRRVPAGATGGRVPTPRSAA
jgi:hypothetical protein